MILIYLILRFPTALFMIFVHNHIHTFHNYVHFYFKETEQDY